MSRSAREDISFTSYGVSHFTPYTGEMFETFMAEQTAFLLEHLT